MNRWIPSLVALALLAGGVGQAGASIVQALNPGQFNGLDTTVTYTGNDGDSVPIPYVLSAGGDTLTFTNAKSQAFVRADEGNTWNPGAYPNGTKLIWNLNPNTNQAGGAVTITFATGVHEVGLFVQQDNTQPGTTTWMFGVNGNSTGFSVSSSNTANPPNGVLSFIGLQDTADDGITSLTISSSDTSSLGAANDFVLGPVTFGISQAIVAPEPTTLGPCILGVVGLLAVRAWRRRPRAGGWGNAKRYPGPTATRKS